MTSTRNPGGAPGVARGTDTRAKVYDSDMWLIAMFGLSWLGKQMDRAARAQQSAIETAELLRRQNELLEALYALHAARQP